MKVNNNNIINFRKSKTPDKSKVINNKYELLSKYIKLNVISFQYLQSKNYKLSKYNFEKCLQISKEIDEYKYIESLINYSISLYFNGEFEDSYLNLLKAKDISTNIYENSDEINQIYFIHLRILSNLSLILMNLNDIANSKKYFYECISFIKEPKIKDTQIQLSMLRELLYIFFRFDSLNKFHEINNQIEDEKNQLNNENNIPINNEEILKSINNNIQINDNGLYYIHKSLKENNITFWLNYLEKEINKNEDNKDEYIFLLINRMAALYCLEDNYNKNNIENALNILIKYYKEKYGKNVVVKNNNYNKMLFDFKNKFNTAVDYYQTLLNLEKEIKLKSFGNKIKNKNGKGNKILINLLFRNAFKNLDNLYTNQNYKKINEIKKQIEYAMLLIEKNKINWNLLSIINIDTDLIKSINTLFYNLRIIRLKCILRYYFNKYKKIALGYITMGEKMKIKYKKSSKFLQKQLLSLEEGSTLLKFNFTSNGFAQHFYKINISDDDCFFCIHKSISSIKPYQVFNLDDLNDITIGFESQNLISKIKPNFFSKYKPWYFLSLWFQVRTIDLYFDNDEEMNKWFEGIYYFNKYIIEKRKSRSLNYFFFTKLKLKLLYKLKNMKCNLPIIKQLKYFESQNQLEYQSLPFPKVLVLYNKVCQKEIK